MKRTTIMIPNEMKAKAQNRAKMMGISFGCFVRESIKASLDNENAESNLYAQDPFFADKVVFTGEVPKDSAKNHDDYLYGEMI